MCVILWTVPGAIICKNKPTKQKQQTPVTSKLNRNDFWSFNTYVPASCLMAGPVLDGEWPVRAKPSGSFRWSFLRLMWRRKVDSVWHLYGQELGPWRVQCRTCVLGRLWAWSQTSWDQTSCFLRALTLGSNRIFNFLCLCSKHYTYIILPSKPLYEEDTLFRPVL